MDRVRLSMVLIGVVKLSNRTPSARIVIITKKILAGIKKIMYTFHNQCKKFKVPLINCPHMSGLLTLKLAVRH